MKTLNETQTQSIVNFLSTLKTEISVTDYVELDEIDLENAFDSITEKLEDNNGFDIEIIYYSNAIAYLKENDPSLNESLEIAAEYGFELKNLNSEVLASLLASSNARDEWSELQDEINDFFQDLYYELEEDEEDEDEE